MSYGYVILNNQQVAQVHVTQIAYQNITSNSFYDLTIGLSVTIANRTIDLSDLFTARMYMAGRDQRLRNFVTMDELGPRGLDLNALTEKRKRSGSFLAIQLHLLAQPGGCSSARIQMGKG